MSALAGLKVLELADERIGLAGKLMADMGAQVILIEPPAGHPSRHHGPYANDQQDIEHSLYFWHYHTSKHSVTLDLQTAHGQKMLHKLLAEADVLLEAEAAAQSDQLGLDPAATIAQHPRLIHITVSSHGREHPDSNLPYTDLTLMAEGGPPWSCGYDDHNLPPVRGWGDQAYHTVSHFAFMSGLTALLYRNQSGHGQHIDVSAVAALNVTTEAASYTHLVNGGEVQRQTGRHAALRTTGETQMQCADGNWANTGVPPRFPVEFARLLDWLRQLDLEKELPEAVFLEMGAEWQGPFDLSKLGEDDTITAVFSAGREALQLIARNLSAQEFFLGCQRAGLTVGVINRPDQAFEDEHFKARGFQVPVQHGAQTHLYPGAPYKLPASPWQIYRPAPKLGEHNQAFLGSASNEE